MSAINATCSFLNLNSIPTICLARFGPDISSVLIDIFAYWALQLNVTLIFLDFFRWYTAWCISTNIYPLFLQFCIFLQSHYQSCLLETVCTAERTFDLSSAVSLTLQVIFLLISDCLETLHLDLSMEVESDNDLWQKLHSLSSFWGTFDLQLICHFWTETDFLR